MVIKKFGKRRYYRRPKRTFVRKSSATRKRYRRPKSAVPRKRRRTLKFKSSVTRSTRAYVSRVLFPQSRVVPMNFRSHCVDTIPNTITTPTRILANYTNIRVNCPYDPQVSLTGSWNQSAALYKTLSGIYNMYQVLSSKITITMLPVESPISATATTTSQPTAAGQLIRFPSYAIGLSLDDDGTRSYDNWLTMSVDPHCKLRFWRPDLTNPKVFKISSKWNAYKEFKDQSAQFCAANMGNLPSRMPQWSLWMQPADMAYIHPWPLAVELHVRVDYRVKCYNPKDAGQASINPPMQIS